MKRALFLCLLLVSLTPTHAAAPPPQWLPQESWPGGRQYDPRLEHTVQFWRTAVPLAGVFAEIERQTGAEIGFWPEGDENPRVRVNLYLNPEAPPTLRELMAQLTWVTDCTFACTTSGGIPTYYLLGSSLGHLPGDAEVLERRVAERVPARRWASFGNDAEDSRQVLTALSELRQALVLPLSEAISRYQGKDEYLLLTLAVPARRAAAEYVCSVIPDGAQPPNGSDWRITEWSELSEEQQAKVAQALQFRGLDREAMRATQTDVMVMWERTHLRLWAAARQHPGGGGLLLGRPVTIAPMPARAQQLLAQLRPDEIVDFGRRCGKQIPEGQEQEYVAQWRSGLTASHRDAKVRAAHGALSPAMSEQLASLPGLLARGHAYALWEVQSVVAAASGVNVVSDCFWQPRRPLLDATSALETVVSACLPGLPGGAAGPRDVGWFAQWEWGDAGTWLRFRARDRDVWRASMLPVEAREGIDAHLAHYLPNPEQPGWPVAGFSIRVPVELAPLHQLAGRLTDLQIVLGSRMLYEDPSDPLGACRQALRAAFLAPAFDERGDVVNAGWSVNVFRLACSLTPEQWETARGRGLRFSELTPDQATLAQKGTSPTVWVNHQDRTSILVLKASDLVIPEGPRRGTRAAMDFTLMQPKETMQWTVPEEQRRDLNLFFWSLRYWLQVDIPRPETAHPVNAERRE